MRAYSHKSSAMRAGRTLGYVWRGVVRQHTRISRWMIAKGVPPPAAAMLLWIVKLFVLTVLLYAALWVALAVISVLIVARVVQSAGDGADRHFDEDAGRPEWEIGELTDHRQSLFYHPLSYNDDPDPRFPDPRYDD